MKTEEIVEALPASAAQDLSRLTWEVPAGVAGVRVSYRTRGRLRLNGGVWYLVDAGGGTPVNVDYLDAESDVATHRSVSPSDLRGAGWELSADVMLVEERSAVMFLRSFVRLGYRGAYHEWSARGGEYEYPGRQGRFADEEIIRYLVLHQVFDVGGFVELGQTGEGLYGRLGGAVSLWSHVDDRDTHLLSDTEYYNTYRRGWHVRPEIALGVRFEGGGAVEVIYEPAWQFAFANDEGQDSERRLPAGGESELHDEASSCRDPGCVGVARAGLDLTAASLRDGRRWSSIEIRKRWLRRRDGQVPARDTLCRDRQRSLRRRAGRPPPAQTNPEENLP